MVACVSLNGGEQDSPTTEGAFSFPPLSYSDFYKDVRWQQKRLEILSRDHWTCQECCVEGKTLHVHHARYIKGRKPWEYDDADLRALCEDCHEAVSVIQAEMARLLAPFSLGELRRVLGYASYFAWVWQVDHLIVHAGQEAQGALDALGYAREGPLLRERLNDGANVKYFLGDDFFSTLHRLRRPPVPPEEPTTTT